MFWSIGKHLQEKLRPFKKIVFLNPDTPDLWALDLKSYEPDKTLLVIDALYRRQGLNGDSDINKKNLKSRWSSLFNLALGNIEYREDEMDVGKFKILATIREDEYEFLKNLVPEQILNAHSREHMIIPELEMILEKYLDVCGVPYCQKDLDKKLIEQKSKGSVSYLWHVAESLKEEKKKFCDILAT
jgi:hypothetical protein